MEHAQGDTTAWEYIVKESKGDLVSVTQKDDKPLAIGQKVLVIAGNQARGGARLHRAATAAARHRAGPRTGHRHAATPAAHRCTRNRSFAGCVERASPTNTGIEPIGIFHLQSRRL